MHRSIVVRRRNNDVISAFETHLYKGANKTHAPIMYVLLVCLSSIYIIDSVLQLDYCVKEYLIKCLVHTSFNNSMKNHVLQTDPTVRRKRQTYV